MTAAADRDPVPDRGSIVGRTAELERVDQFLDASSGTFAVLRIQGPPGIGKSTVWREACDRAARRGYAVLECRPGPGEARMSFASVGDLLERLPPAVLDALPEPQRRAIDIALLREAPTGQAVGERVLGTAIRSVLTALARDTPVVVAIDDVQWLDASSAAVISFAARRLGGAPVGLLVAHRAGTPDPLTADRLEARHNDALEIGPLTVAALHHVIHDQLGEAPSRSVLVRIHDAAGGNPLFALEIARMLPTAGVPAPGRTLPVPEDVQSTVSARIRALPGGTRRTLLAMAAAGVATEDDLVRLLGRPVADDIDHAGDEGIVRRDDVPGAPIAFAHPLFAAAVYATATPTARRAVHREIAAHAGDPEQRARHLALAAEKPDAATADALEAAAASAAARGAIGSSAELYELAWRATPADGAAEAIRRRTRHAELLHDAGDTTRGWAMIADVVRDAPAGPLRARALLEQIRLAHTMGTLDDTTRIGEAALAEARGDDPLTAEILATLARITPNPALTLQYADAALAILDASPRPDPSVLSNALTAKCGWAARVNADGLPPADLVERALELERAHPLPRVGDRFSATLGVLLKYADDFAGARHWLGVTLRSALDEGDEGTLPYVYSHLPQLELWTGDWERAADTARRHLALAEETGQESQRRQALFNVGMVQAHRGDEVEARAVLGDALAAAAGDGDTWTEAICLGSLGMLELSLGRAAEAATALERVQEIWASFGDTMPRRHEPDLIEALLAGGDVERARALAVDLTGRAAARHRRSMQAQAARARGLVAAARGEGDAALVAFDEAFEHHAAVRIPFDHARTLLALGVVRRRRRERGLARDALAAALAEFERLGARLWAERAGGELERLGLRRGSGDELTESELRVAGLAAAGRTNREIGATLFMSPKTVDANLGRVYRKLGIRSRAELGAWMAGRQT